MTHNQSESKVLCEAGMVQSGAVVMLEDEYQSNLSLEKFDKADGAVNLQNASMNIENSEVIIGPVTQFHAPVTIYQNVNGTQEIKKQDQFYNSSPDGGNYLNNSASSKEDASSNDLNSRNNPTYVVRLVKNKYVKFVGIPVILTIILLIIVLSVIITKSDVISNGDDIVPELANETMYKCAIIPKSEWGAKEKYKVPLLHPTSVVIVSHSVTEFCSNAKECRKRVKSMQEYHVAQLNSPDIGYNFIIGGDGNIYVGRGWDTRNFHQDNTIGLNFIGNFLYDELTPKMISCAQNLLERGVNMKKLSANYKLVGHSQTFATESPGPNIMKVITKWSHYYNGTILP